MSVADDFKCKSHEINFIKIILKKISFLELNYVHSENNLLCENRSYNKFQLLLNTMFFSQFTSASLSGQGTFKFNF